MLCEKIVHLGMKIIKKVFWELDFCTEKEHSEVFKKLEFVFFLSKIFLLSDR